MQNRLVFAAVACYASCCVSTATAMAAPAVHSEATYAVKQQFGVHYGAGILCNANTCTMSNTSACQATQPPTGGDPALAKFAIKGCEKPATFSLTLDLYTPIGAVGKCSLVT